MTDEDDLSLTDFARELLTLAGKNSLSYHQLWAMAARGTLSSHRCNGRYYVKRKELHALATWLRQRADFMESPPPKAA
jgi:hypothetical protein